MRAFFAAAAVLLALGACGELVHASPAGETCAMECCEGGQAATLQPMSCCDGTSPAAPTTGDPSPGGALAATPPIAAHAEGVAAAANGPRAEPRPAPPGVRRHLLLSVFLI